MGERIGRKNRTRLEIAASMLDIAQKGVRKTHLMYEGNLSFELLQKYLESLLRASLIEEQQERNQFIYKTTAKGFRFLEDYKDLQNYVIMIESKKNELEKYLSMQRSR